MKKLLAVATMAVMLCLTGLVISGTAIAQQCVDNGDGTVTDNGTGLMWQKATAGPMNWDAAMSYASSLSLGGHSGWGLPSKDELLGLYHGPSCRDMMDVRKDYYWSSTTYALYTDYAWLVNYLGGVGSSDKSGSYYIRAVRAGQ
ncbi:MAG: DUF1566 domain-containing protein [Desulfonatronovibrio sp.]